MFVLKTSSWIHRGRERLLRESGEIRGGLVSFGDGSKKCLELRGAGSKMGQTERMEVVEESEYINLTENSAL